MSVLERLTHLKKKLDGVRLIAVSKYASDGKVMEAYEFGQRDFAENYVQNLRDRAERFPDDIRWHMIGHVQRNKVKYLARIKNLSMIQSIDSIRLAREIEKRFQHPVDCLVEVNLSGESSKSGISPEKVFDLFEEFIEEGFDKINITGLMTISPLSGTSVEKERCFKELADLREKINLKFRNSRLTLIELSMGMTDDFELALKNGSTMVRIGSYIFS